MSVDTSLKTEVFEKGVRKNSFILDNNKWYNTTGVGGYSTCIVGSPSRSGANVLCNCVGLANGAFNETYVKCKQTLDSSFVPKQYYAFTSNGNTTITRAKSLGLETIDPSGVPPLGGLISWGGGANHVAYIADVIDNDTIVIVQAGYDTPIWSQRNTADTGWVCDARTIKRGSSNLWAYQNSVPSGTVCQGFVVNPAVADAIEAIYGVRLGNQLYSAHIWKDGKWNKTIPHLWSNGKWNKTN